MQNAVHRQTIDTLGNALNPTDTPDDPLAADVVR
jgi:gamma-glutamyl-gamma-aminobutyrate hydrolase PuuD